ncbi:MAG: PAS domain S-box protein, partial [Candidatus Omnitrophica bacterium]|nr:PAS domain S-box protein [Candidatus Omnitrophota bacterium]
FVASHVLKNISMTQRHTLELFASSLGGIIVRLKAEEMLKESEHCFRSIAEQTGQIVYDYDISTGSIQWSGAVETVTGYQKEEFRNFNLDDWAQQIHPDDRIQALELLQDAMRENIPYDAQYHFRQKDGNYIFIEAHGIHFSDKEGNPYRMVGTMSDITHRKESEELLRKSEEKYRVLVENANSVILRLDKVGCIMFLNEFGEKFFGFTEDEILGKNAVGTIVPGHDDEGRNLEEMIKDICVHPDRYASNENQNICKDGQKVWMAWTNRAIINDAGEPEVLCVGTDITARKKAEEKLTIMYKDLEKVHENLKETQNQLLQSEKMAAIGQLSAGVAHEVKNPLAVILLSVAALEGQLKDLSDDNRKYLKMISDAAGRANKVVVQLLSFSRYAEVHFERQALHHILENVIALAKMSFKEKAIEFHQEFINKDLYVKGDKILIEQAFLNLVSNAADAIVGEGKITIKTNIIELIDKKCKEVIVMVEDTGEGIPEEFRLKIFEPFFTTKELGKGTGLGLSVVYTILERHGGRISFESETGKGTKFFVALPLLSDSETEKT